jgi:osmotically inducible protein OsmC
MAVRTANAEWVGALQDGSGKMAFGSGAFEGQFSYASRFEEGTGTNPEELIGAAHAGCFSMSLANLIATAGHDVQRVETTARVHLEPAAEGPSITRIELQTEAEVPGVDDEEFQRQREDRGGDLPGIQGARGRGDLARRKALRQLVARLGHPERHG